MRIRRFEQLPGGILQHGLDHLLGAGGDRKVQDGFSPDSCLQRAIGSRVSGDSPEDGQVFIKRADLAVAALAALLVYLILKIRKALKNID